MPHPLGECDWQLALADAVACRHGEIPIELMRVICRRNPSLVEEVWDGMTNEQVTYQATKRVQSIVRAAFPFRERSDATMVVTGHLNHRHEEGVPDGVWFAWH